MDKKNFICNGCIKSFSSKYNLERHNKICNLDILGPYKDVIDNLNNQNNELTYENNCLLQNAKDLTKDVIFYKLENSELKNQIKELQDKLENIALKAVSRPTNTTNNNTTNVNTYIQQLDIVTDQTFIDNLKNFSIEYIKKGAEGFANYALEHPLNNRIACVDYARKKIKYKDENGNIISDPEMMKLSTQLFKSILSKNKELIAKYVNEVTYSSLSPDEKMQIMVDMTDNMFLVNRGADGEKHELYDAFLKNMCSKSLVR